MKSGLELLPDEVIITILSIVNDIKSLIRCLLISKHLASLIPSTTSVTMRIEEPLPWNRNDTSIFPTISSQFSVRQVADYVKKTLSRPKVTVDVIISNPLPENKEYDMPLDQLHFTTHPNTSLWSFELYERYNIALDKVLQYYVNSARQKLSNLTRVETVKVELPCLHAILLYEMAFHPPIMKWKFEYSGGTELIKSCSTYGCNWYCEPEEVQEYEEEELNEKKMMMKEFLETKKIIQPNEQEIVAGVGTLLNWMGVYLKLALSFHPMVEEMVRDHEMLQDLLLTSVGGSAQFHVGKDAIERMRREKTCSASVMKMMTDTPLNMKMKMWHVPLLECSDETLGDTIVDRINFGIARVVPHLFGEDDDELKNEISDFFVGSRNFVAAQEPDLFHDLEVKMMKITNMMPYSTAQLDAIWLFKQHTN